MNLDTHYLILYGIGAVAVVVWVCGLQFLLSTPRRTAKPEDSFDDDYDVIVEPGEATVRGSAEVAGRPAELAAKAAAHLAQHGATTLGPVKILEQTDQRVAFEALPHFAGRFLRHGVLDFTESVPGRTRIDYAVLVPKRNGLLAAAWIVQVAGLCVLVIGFAVMLLWVAPHPNPAVHWQSVQMVHVVHFLWPPFLCAGLYRRVQTYVRTTFDSLVNNLPYLQG